MSIVCQSRRAIRLVALALGAAALACPARVSAQGMMSGVDLATPAFTQAELSRGDIEGLIAKVKPGQKLDLAGKSLNNLDLSKLDLAGADLRGARLNHANFAGADLRGAVLDDVWALDADFSRRSVRRAAVWRANVARQIRPRQICPARALPAILPERVSPGRSWRGPTDPPT